MDASTDKQAIPSISVIIPTRNASETLRELLAILSQQTLAYDELIIVDSSSEDRTLLIAKDFGAKVIVIPKEEFDHGGTRSMAARKVAGEIVVFMTQDAIPVDTRALENLLKPLLYDPAIWVSYGRQLPEHGANIFAAHLRAFNYPDKAQLRSYEDRKELGLKTIFVSNSFAAYRKKKLEKVNYFQSGLIFGEDTCTVGRLLAQGGKVAYVTDALVYHSHNYSWLQEVKRSFDIGVLHTSEQWLLTTYGRAEGEGLRYVSSEITNLFQQREIALLPSCLCRNILKFFAYKLGRIHRILPGFIIPFLSMHKSWWSRNQENRSR